MYSGETFALRIGIEQSPTVRERYRLRFLNSYGVYEVFSLEGEASVTPGMDEDCLLYTSGILRDLIDLVTLMVEGVGGMIDMFNKWGVVTYTVTEMCIRDSLTGVQG